VSAVPESGITVASRIALYQLAVGLLAGLVWWVFAGVGAGAAAAAGGAVSALLSYYTGIRTFGPQLQNSADMVRNFYQAQARKFVLAIVLFVIAIKLFGSHFLPFITAYMATIAVYWFSLLWDK